MSENRDLLFAAYALCGGLIRPEQFAAACTHWMNTRDTTLAGLIDEHGWLSDAGKAQVEEQVRRAQISTIRDVKTDPSPAGGDAGQAPETIDSRARIAAAEADATGASITRAWIPSGDTKPSLGPARTPGPAASSSQRDRYELTRLHAAGGIGQVWLARDAHLGREVALKELKPERAGNPALAARFLEEARVTGQLEHPGIVPIYELIEPTDGQQPFYTMRFIRGRTLSHAVSLYHHQRTKEKLLTLELRDLLNAFVAVCHAVAYAHSRGVLHRDLKGQNVVLGDFGEVILLDWGLSKIMGQSTPDGDGRGSESVTIEPSGSRDDTMHGEVIGTPAYMAPEQAAGRIDQIDQRTDIYGLGAILYEILTRRAPFTGSQSRTVIEQVRNIEPDRPRQLVPTTPRALEAICLKALAKDPRARYASALELAREVLRFLADEPVQAYAEPWAVRLGRWARRHKPLVAGAAVLLITALVAISISRYLIGQEQSRTKTALQISEADFKMARETIDQMLVRLADDRLPSVPQAEEMRIEIVREALTRYGRMLGSRTSAGGANDAELSRAAARAFRQGANIYRLTSQLPQARTNYQQAIGIMDELLYYFHGQAVDRYGRTMTMIDLAGLTNLMGRAREAEQLYRAALADAERLRAESPADARFVQAVGTARLDLGETLAEMGRDADGWREAVEAERLLAPLADRPRAGTIDVLLNLMAAGNQCGSLRALGRLSEARQKFERTLPIARQFDHDHPDENTGFVLASLLYEQGVLDLLDESRRVQAEKSFGEAIGIFERLAAEHPSVPGHREHLGLARDGRGSARAKLGQLAAAEDDFNQARRIFETLAHDDPERPAHQGHLGRSLANLGRMALDANKKPAAQALLAAAVDHVQRSLKANADSAIDTRALPRIRADLARAQAAPPGDRPPTRGGP